MSNPLVLIDHPGYRDHDTGGGLHPEVPGRVEVVRRHLAAGRLGPLMVMHEPKVAERAHCLAVHEEAYLFRLEESCLMGLTSVDHSDNQITYDSFDVAQLSAGGALAGVDLLESGAAAAVFCLVRPPGHHAERDRALGFCFLNNAAIAARYWQSRHGRQRILIVDWDAHHGNGIQNIFLHDADVFYVSIHEHPTFSFPGTGFADENGVGEGLGRTLNIPLPPGAGDAQILEAMEQRVLPAITAFAPQAMVVAAGFDGHRDDDMSGLLYSTALYGQLGAMMRQWAAGCQGRLLSILEGGYNLEVLGPSVEAYLLGLTSL